MQNGRPKVIIVNAERHRRTPRLVAISGVAMYVWVVGFSCGRFNVRRWQKLATSSSLLHWRSISDQFLAVGVESQSGI